MEKTKKLSNTFKISLIAIFLIAVFCIAITPVTLQNDTYYTIKIGEHIENNGIDMKDPFSWHDNLDYTYPHWLYDLLTFKIFSQFGFEGIYVVTVILSVILGLSLYFVSSKISKNNIIAFLVTFGALYLIKDYIAARAQLVTFILFVWSIFCIEKFIENRKIRYGVALFGIATLIANLHVAVWPFFFVLFLPYIGELFVAILGDFIIYRKFNQFKLKFKIKHSKNEMKIQKYKEQLRQLEEKLEKIKVKRTNDLQNPYKIKIEKNKNVKWLILVMLICVVTGFLTPLGDTPFTYLIKTMQGNTTQNINEHLPMTLSAQPETLCAIIILLGILTFTKTKIKLRDLFMIGGLSYLMLLSKRQVTMFALVGTIILGKLIVDFVFGDTAKKQGLSERVERLEKIALKPIIVIAMILVVGWFSWTNCKDKFDDKIVDPRNYPVAACDYILKNIDLSKARFYNEYNYGSYMLFRGIPVFIDSRADLYAPEFSGLEDDIFMDFINVSSVGTFYEDIFEKYNITHAIMNKNAKISMIIDKTNDSNYKKIYSDNYFVIYQRLNAKER
ncbi:MAG: hypothetical protein J5881_02180 [Clostridia bacterium]|nr:hypothetical protein [Clostridia bacterium]